MQASEDENPEAPAAIKSRPLSGTSDLNFVFFYILEYLHIHSELTWKRDPGLNPEFTSVSYTLHAHSQKAILYNSFSAPVFCL